MLSGVPPHALPPPSLFQGGLPHQGSSEWKRPGATSTIGPIPSNSLLTLKCSKTSPVIFFFFSDLVCAKQHTNNFLKSLLVGLEIFVVCPSQRLFLKFTEPRDRIKGFLYRLSGASGPSSCCRWAEGGDGETATGYEPKGQPQMFPPISKLPHGCLLFLVICFSFKETAGEKKLH